MSRGNLPQRATPRPQTSQAPQSPSVGYKGTSVPQRTVKDIMSEYPDVKVKNSGPACTPLRKQAIQTPGSKKTFTKQAIYLNPMQNRHGSLVTKDARRTWEAAVIVSPGWLYQKNMWPPSDDEHAKMKKMNVSVFLGRPLRETAWLSRAVNILPGVEDNYLDSLNIELRNQFEDRYTLLMGETFAINARYARGLEARLPMPNERLQRAHYALIVDSTFLNKCTHRRALRCNRDDHSTFSNPGNGRSSSSSDVRPRIDKNSPRTTSKESDILQCVQPSNLRRVNDQTFRD